MTTPHASNNRTLRYRGSVTSITRLWFYAAQVAAFRRLVRRRAAAVNIESALYLLPHQLNMPPMRPPVSNALFCLASKVS
jgi:hypothetical protein